MNRSIFSGMLFLALCSAAQAAIDPTSVPITRFLEVTPDIYRGARPSIQGLTVLAKEGLRTDLDLEDVPSVISAEQSTAEKLGLQFISQPMSGSATPDDAQVDQTLKILNDPANYPIFVHCKLGEDRSGMIVGLYRVFTQNWTAADAYSEMLKDGFHPFLTGLKDYFDQKTTGH
jgi:tyrosine-protein phosphatase SIW14